MFRPCVVSILGVDEKLVGGTGSDLRTGLDIRVKILEVDCAGKAGLILNCKIPIFNEMREMLMMKSQNCQSVTFRRRTRRGRGLHKGWTELVGREAVADEGMDGRVKEVGESSG